MKLGELAPLLVLSLGVCAGCGGNARNAERGTGGASPSSSGAGAGAPVGGSGGSNSSGVSGSSGWLSAVEPEAPSVVSGLVTWKVGPSGTARLPAAAFLEDELAVAAVAGIYRPRVVVDLLRSDGFDQVELEPGTSIDGLALTVSSQGFVAAWWTTEQPGGSDPGRILLQAIGLDGALSPAISLAEGVSRQRCDLASLGEDRIAVLCGSSLSLCSGTSCAAQVLPDCTDAGGGRLAWNGSTLSVARVCSVGTNLGALRLSRLLPTGEPELAERELATESFYQARPAVAADSERTFLIFAERVYVVDAEGELAAAPVSLGEARPLDVERVYEAQLMLAGDVLVASSCSFSAFALERRSSLSTTLLLDKDLAVLGALPLMGSDCDDLSFAASSSGREIVAHRAGETIAIRELDLPATTLGPPRFFDGVASPPDVQDVACTGTKCRVAIGVRGFEPSGADIPGRLTEFLFDVESAARPVKVRAYDCEACRALITSSGATVLLDKQSLRWMDVDGNLAWQEALPAGAEYWGPRGRSAPYLAINANSSTLLHLDAAGVTRTSVVGFLNPAVVCDQGIYRLNYAGNGTGFTPVAPPEPFPELFIEGDAGAYPICVADQIGVIEELRASRFRRFSLTGERLSDVPLPGTAFVQGGEGHDAVIVVSQSSLDSTAPGTEFVIVRIPSNGDATRTSVSLPEPGILHRVWSNGGRVHFSWNSERAEWLSSVP